MTKKVITALNITLISISHYKLYIQKSMYPQVPDCEHKIKVYGTTFTITKQVLMKKTKLKNDHYILYII